MGSFGGHAVPGTFFFCFGFWFVLSALRRRIYWRPPTKHQGIGPTSRPQANSQLEAGVKPAGCCARFRAGPMEAYLKVACCVIGVLIEGPAGIYFRDKARYQHSTMYFCFGFSGVVDLLVHYRAAPGQITEQLGTLAFAVSFIVEGVLFRFHLHGREYIDVQLHMLLVYVCFTTALVCLIEMRHPGSTFGRLLMGYVTMVHGSWFWQVAAILYPLVGTPWDVKDHHSVMLVALIFSWHLFTALVVVVLTAVAVNGCCCGAGRRRLPLDDDDDSVTERGGGFQYLPASTGRSEEKQMLLEDGGEEEELEL